MKITMVGSLLYIFTIFHTVITAEQADLNNDKTALETLHNYFVTALHHDNPAMGVSVENVFIDNTRAWGNASLILAVKHISDNDELGELARKIRDIITQSYNNKRQFRTVRLPKQMQSDVKNTLLGWWNGSTEPSDHYK